MKTEEQEDYYDKSVFSLEKFKCKRLIKYKVIKTCKDCENLIYEKVYTGDSFENVFNWVCKEKSKLIQKNVEGFDVVDRIPKWCPLPNLK